MGNIFSGNWTAELMSDRKFLISNSMNIETFISELESNLIGAELGTLGWDTRFRELPYWDSLAALSLLSTFDSVFGRQLSGQALASCETLGDVFALSQS